MKLFLRMKRHVPVPLKRFLGRHYMRYATKLHGDSVAVADGRNFKVVQDRLFLGVLINRDYEPHLTNIASKMVVAGDTVLDIGANFGWYSTLFGKLVGPSGAVHSFEPFPRTFSLLSDNVELNDLSSRVHLHNACVSNSTDEVPMSNNAASESGLAHVTSTKDKDSVMVKSVRIDSEVESDIDEIAYVKIDIEGYELFALQGMEKVLSAGNPPVIQIELNEEALQRAGCEKNQVVSLLINHGYTFYQLSETHSELLVESKDAADADVFCMPRGKYKSRFEPFLQNAGKTGRAA